MRKKINRWRFYSPLFRTVRKFYAQMEIRNDLGTTVPSLVKELMFHNLFVILPLKILKAGFFDTDALAKTVEILQ